MPAMTTPAPAPDRLRPITRAVVAFAIAPRASRRVSAAAPPRSATSLASRRPRLPAAGPDRPPLVALGLLAALETSTAPAVCVAAAIVFAPKQGERGHGGLSAERDDAG